MKKNELDTFDVERTHSHVVWEALDGTSPEHVVLWRQLRNQGHDLDHEGLELGNSPEEIRGLRARIRAQRKEEIDRELDTLGNVGPKASAESAGRRQRGSSPSVLRRRQIVMIAGRRARPEQVCLGWDQARVPLPENTDWYSMYGVKDWMSAYKNPKLKRRIQRIIAQDRAANRGSH